MRKYELLSCVWEITLACNLKCLHCGSSAGKKRDDELDLDKSLKLCVDLKKTGCKAVALMGGEPLLSPHFKDIAIKIRELGMELCVITNGTLYNDEIIEFLAKLKPRAVATSIDGSTASTHDKIRGVNGAFKKTMNFMEKCLEKDIPLSVITSVSKLNISELSGIAQMIKGKKIAWQIQMVGAEGIRFDKRYLLDEDEFYSVGVFIEALRRRYSIYELAVIGAHDMGYNSCFIKNIWLYDKWQGCQAGISVVGIRSNGDVVGCLSINNDRFVEGNINERSIYDIWNDSNSFSYNRKFKKEDAGPLCADCCYIAECGGGCSEVSLMKTGMIHNDPYCFYRYEKKHLSWFKRFLLSLYSRFWIKKDTHLLNRFFGGERNEA